MLTYLQNKIAKHSGETRDVLLRHILSIPLFLCMIISSIILKLDIPFDSYHFSQSEQRKLNKAQRTADNRSFNFWRFFIMYNK
ncbi:hypothetical protein GLOIN_2v1639766 [Rhizophagus irregularis DAOM 181602=DAOM 197198]|uniref:Uncharacterized protein n=1 Tax=Rhizophagus irregularis (strain DAOM 181602 / DAOM 197198 / MUCL 43194) TaxID=747089 RepID=A0A2P4PRY4_RHIID|nr:hypothetical protein GLOIN_2v1639766 [Rhizophagus irregularis DAOM 181602=DAOM 197198]POG68161.1 hypothetical protein GLOIN_2v1639766 [Rhizophagus irregularis DAOM 181602=DAOM 197198]GET55350.1 hypothetical protein GLOIN_2v1639766 [Rhizophagus irregularis DAOM 181602=DAOM 197198]|eukprot:XP_025175027.1 hypothetical protein GLOIN_2v1639766 [Rhizophagus irregularis DAOM 181602=DAOM 197198]